MKGKANQREAVSDALRTIIDGCGATRYAICKASDVDQATLSRFMARKQSLTLDAVDRMAEFLGLKLTAKRKAKRPKGR